jgi:hypothetical protein
MFQQSTQHVASYYAYSCANRLTTRPALVGDHDTEIVIIGAGFSGLHTALRLALAGKRVTLEASRVAVGCIGAQWRAGHSRLVVRHAAAGGSLGYERARRLWDGMRGPPGSCVNCPGVMASTATIGPGTCGLRSCRAGSAC